MSGGTREIRGSLQKIYRRVSESKTKYAQVPNIIKPSSKEHRCTGQKSVLLPARDIKPSSG